MVRWGHGCVETEVPPSIQRSELMSEDGVCLQDPVTRLNILKPFLSDLRMESAPSCGVRELIQTQWRLNCLKSS